MIRFRRLIAVASLVSVAVPCLVVAALRASSLVVRAGEAYRRLQGSSLEELRLATYGDCGERGYGYVIRILEGFPDPDARPRVRYSDYDRYVEIVLPRFPLRVDERVLIGIGVGQQQLEEERIAMARRTDGSDARRVFASKWDYDLMTGALVHLEKPISRPVRFDLVLRHSELDPSPLARWSVEVPAGSGPSLMLRADRPVERFSVARGGVDFVLEVTADDDDATITAVDAVGVRVDARGYVIARRDGGCFVAVRADFIDSIRDLPDHPWRRWLERVESGA